MAAIIEIAKRSGLWGGALTSIPLISLLVFVWLYAETRDTDKVVQLSMSIFWLVLATLLLFLVLPFFIKRGLDFYTCLDVGVVLTAIC